ncbi:MAG: hypothetical protein AB1611_17995 [bacterium]
MLTKPQRISLYGVVLAFFCLYPANSIAAPAKKPAPARIRKTSPAARSSTPVHRSSMSGNINILFGQKLLDDNDWEPVENQFEFGIEADIKELSWPVSITMSYAHSSDDDTVYYYDYDPYWRSSGDIEGKTSELNIGVKKIWDQPSGIHPFLAGGLSIIDAEREREFWETRNHVVVRWKSSDSDSGLGIWFGGGIYWTLNQIFNLGVELKYSHAEVTLFNEDCEAGGLHYGILLGYHF